MPLPLFCCCCRTSTPQAYAIEPVANTAYPPGCQQVTDSSPQVSLDYFSDVLCIWAYVAEARLDELNKQFGDQVQVNHRVCKVFADTQHKMDTVWKSRGSYEGFATHLHEVANQYDHIQVHKDIWRSTRPLSSTPAHLVLKAVQHIAPELIATITMAVRDAFFREARDIGNQDVLNQIVADVGLSVAEVDALLCSGKAHALLEADMREKEALNITGSPTYVLNEGRQKLYGNVGYGVLEANIKELLRSPYVGAASWC